MSTLTLRGLSKRFAGAGPAAVDGVDLTIPEGTLVTLLGPSGCGKTTLLRLITGFLQPDAGSILIGGEDVTHLPPHRRDIGMVYQSYALWPHMSVAENVAFGLEMRGVARAERARRVAEALALVGLAEYGDRAPTQLSGGQQQRVALARALVIRPRVLLLDEPLSSLDANLRKDLRFHIRELQQQLRVTTVFVTHDQEEALAVSDHVVLMRGGRIVQMGSGEELYRRPGSAFAMTFMGDANILDGIVSAIDTTGVRLATPLGELRCEPPAAVLRALTIQERVRVGIRPEDVGLAPLDTPPADGNGAAPDAALRVVGRVCSATFLGPWQRFEVEAGEPNTRLHVRLPTVTPDSAANGQRLQPGDAVGLRIAPGAVAILREMPGS